MSSPVKIACLQTRPMPTFDAAIDEAMRLAESVTDSDIVFLPEYCGGLASDGPALAPPAAPDSGHPMVAAFQEVAARLGVWVMLGSVAVEGPGGRIINRGYMLDDQGEVRGRYDKIHLFDVQLSESEVYRESARVTPGNRAVIHDTPFGRVGHTICYDLRFPQLFRTLAQAGADIIACPAAFTRRTGERHWHVLNRARAIENTCYIISPCAVGPIKGGGESYGHSLVVDPWGEVVADGGSASGVVRAQIDIDKVASARARIPSLAHDRAIRQVDHQKRVA